MIKYEWTDGAVAEEIGKRFKELRLRVNISLEELSRRTLISINTLKRLEKGKGKLDTMIAVLRHHNRLEELNLFIAPIEISPIQLMKLAGRKKRLRATKKGNKENPPGYRIPVDPITKELRRAERELLSGLSGSDPGDW